MTDQGGGGCANVRDASAARARPIERKARVDHRFGASHLSDARASASSRATSTSARSTSDCGGSAGVSRIRGADDVAREHELLGDERCSPPTLLQHQEGGGRLYADIQGGPVRLRSQPIDIGQSGCAAVSANAGQRNLLLEREAHVRATQHERQVIERGREHRVVESGHDGGPLLTRANTCAQPGSRRAARLRAE